MTISSGTAEAFWKDRLTSLRHAHRERVMRMADGPAGPEFATGRSVKLSFCSNDYLGLADDPELKAIAASSMMRWGTGAGASRLVSGNQTPHEALESRVASFTGAESAVLFASGYQANVGALAALTAQGDAIFSDRLNHASLIDGARLSKADVHVYRHSDMDHLAELLRSVEVTGLRLIVTDAVFSMDGDVTKLDDIVSLAETYDAAVYLDEAHALGIMGPRGAGLAAKLDLTQRIAVRLGTFSKAFGVCGAFVALSADAAALLKSTARSLLYSTAPPAALSEIVSASLERVATGDHLRTSLKKNVLYFKQLAAGRALPLIPSNTPIQPILTGAETRTMAASQALWDRGFFVQGIRPPTVPKGKSRLRVTVSAKHSESQISGLVEALAATLSEVGE
jgi:8-amino-7-oxononanoate synthase